MRGLLLAGVVAGLAVSAPAKTLTWQSTVTTAWETAGNWFDEGTLATSTTAPAAADAVTINSARSATIQPSITVTTQACKSLVVGNGFTLTLSGAAASPMLTVGDSLAGNNDITIQNGGQIINASTAASGNPFTLASTSNDKFRMDSGGTYVHNTARSYTSPFPAAQQDFDANSTFIWRGSSTIAPSVVFSSRTFGNVVIESTSGNCTPVANTGTGTVNVNGSLSIGATGAGTVNYVISVITVTSPWNIASNLTVGAGSTNIFAAMPITLNGNLTNNGVMTYNTNSGTFTFNGTAAVVAGSAAPTFGNGFTVGSGKAVTLRQGVAVSGGTATNNGTLMCDTSTVSGAGNFNLAAGATLGVGSATGVNGNLTVSGTKTLNTGATYIFNGTAAQTTAGLPATVSTLTITNSLAVASGGVTLSANVTATNLNLTAGRLITSANQVIIPDAGTITPAAGGSGSYVDGTLQKVYASTGTKSFNFPVGAGTVFSPCGVTNMVVTVTGNLTASTTTGDHANIGTSTLQSAKDANRSWTMTAGGGLTVSGYSAICSPVNGDLDGGATLANFVMEKWNGSTWSRAASSSVAGNTVTGNGFASFSDFAVGEPQAVPTSPAGVGGASPATVGRGNTTLLTVTVTPGSNPTSSGITVTNDLSLIGGSSAQKFYDDGSNGDVTIGDNIFSYSATVSTGTSVGIKSLAVAIADAQGRTNSANISVTVAGVDRVWAGSGPDDNWTTATNWSGNLAPIAPEDSVVFTGSTRLTPLLNTSYTVPGLTFNSGASSFTLGSSGGSVLTLNGGSGLTNNSANAQTVSLPIVLGSAQTFAAAGAGLLTLNSNVNNGGNLLTVDGANNSAVNGAVSGGGGLTKTGAGTVTLAGGNSYGGATTVSGGMVAVSGGAAIPDASSVTLANTAGVTLSLNASETIASLAASGATNATVALGMNNLTAGGATTISSAITGTGKLVKTGAGTVTMDRATAYGTDFTLRVEGGMVDLNRGGAAISPMLGSGNKVELAGGTLQCSGNVQANIGISFGELDVFSDSTLSINRNSVAQSSTSPTFGFALDFKSDANLAFIYNDRITSGTTTFSAATNTLEANAKLTLGAYAVTVSGVVAGTGSHSLTKAGLGTLTLANTNLYSGNTTNLAGILTATAGNTFGSGALVLAGGDILSTATRAGAPLANPLIVAGSGTNNIYGDSTATAPSTRILPFSSSLTGSTGTLRVGNKGLANNTFELRLTGGGFTLTQPVIVGDAAFDTAGALSVLKFYNDTNTAAQIFSGAISGSGSLLRDTAIVGAGGTTILSGSNTYSGGTIITGGFIGLGTDSASSGGAVTNGPVGTGTLEIQSDPNTGLFAVGGPRTVDNKIFLNGAVNLQITGTNHLAFGGSWNIGSTAKTLTVNNTGLTTIAGVITNTAALTKAGSGKLALSGANLFSGSLTVAAGTLALSGSGSVSNTPAVTLTNNATLDASGRTDGTFTLNSSQTLNGSGSVSGSVVTVSGSTLAPGFAAALGTLTVSSNATLAGLAYLKINRDTATNDVMSAGGTLTEGGTLTVTNISGTLVVNDTFKLFSAGVGFSGSFAATNLPALNTGLQWDTSALASSGIIKVAATVNTGPTNITSSVSGGILTLTWPADHTGWRLQAQTNSLNAGLGTNWQDVAGSTATNQVTATIDAATGAVFYRLIYP